jgi:hypothetical protein
VAEAAAAGAAAHNLDGRAVVDGLNERNDEIGDGRRHLGDDGFQHFGGRFRHVGRDGLHRAVFVIGHVVKTGHVTALDLGDVTQLRFAVQVFGGAQHADDFEKRFFAFADDKDVDERGHRFRVVAGVTAGDDERVAGVAVEAAHRHSGQIEQVEGVGETAARRAG